MVNVTKTDMTEALAVARTSNTCSAAAVRMLRFPIKATKKATGASIMKMRDICLLTDKMEARKLRRTK